MRALVGVLGGFAVLAGCGPSDDEGGCKDKLLAGDIVITEVFADYAAPTGGTGTDEGKEWVEIYNASDRVVDLKGLTITHGRVEGGTTAPKSHTMTSITVAPGTYLVLGNSTADLLPAYIDYGYSNTLGDFFNSDGGKLDLTCGSTLVDSANYEGVKSGHSRELSAAQPPDYQINDIQTNWCEATDTEFETNNFGTPGQDNDCRPSVIGQCFDGNGMRDTVAPTAGQLVITEVMPSPGAVSDTVGEWFEAKATASFDLNGVGLDRAGDTANPKIIDSPDCVHVNSGQFVIFAKNADAVMNGGLPTVSGIFTFSMVSGSVTTPGDAQIVYNGTLIDAITWTKSTNNKALQLDPDLTDATSNDSPSNFCDATTQYGTGAPQDFGTPTAANTQCTLLPPPGMCDMGAGVLRNIVKPPAGALVITEYLADPGGTDGVKEWIEVNNTGGASFDLNGLIVADVNDVSTINSAACIPIAAGTFGLLGRSTDITMNGGLLAVDATFGFSLVNGGAVGTPAVIEIRDGTTVLDHVQYETTMTAGKSKQLDSGSFTAAGNDNASAAPWCNGTTQYGTSVPMDFGTPKAANATCP
jgi:hypothetical protein